MHGFIIRDGTKEDISICLKLDHCYTTDTVLRLNIEKNQQRKYVSIEQDRLPREVEFEFPKSKRRLILGLSRHHCFLVAQSRNGNDVLGYLTMRNDPTHQIGWIQDVVVAPEFRRNQIGSRLLAIAKRWALEHDIQQLSFEIQSKNYPASLFCQSQGYAFSGYNEQYFGKHDIAVFYNRDL